ncbi:MAG: dihydrolipoyl dehydrogenase [Acidobacteriota bacterium]
MANRQQAEFDVVVLGGGPGGYVAAFRAADLGLKTAVVDVREKPGGVCVYEGCIPSKALLHVAALISEAQHAQEIGVSFGKPKINLDKLREFKDKVVGNLTAGAGQLAKARKIEWILGRGRFESSQSILVQGQDGERRVQFKHAILASGSRVAELPGVKLESDRLMTSTEALELESIPETLLVVGGGYIGLEMGSVYAALGSKVTVVEFLDTILPGVDKDLVRPLKKRLGGLLEAIHLNSKVVGMKEVEKGIEAEFEGDIESKQATFEKVLVSVGRKPNSEDLGLENTAVQVGKDGFIRIDDRCRTDDGKIFAIGDVAGEPMLAHKAGREGRVAAEVIAGLPSAFDNVAIPAVVFTDPEVAWCGLTEAEAKLEGVEVKVHRFPWAASGRAQSLGRTDGLTKILFEPDSGRILGMGIVGPNAGELIAEGVLAIEMAAVAEDLAVTIHTHPTLSETIMEAAESFLGHATHIYRK